MSNGNVAGDEVAHFRWVTLRDLPDLERIARASPPFPAEEIRPMLARRETIGMVAERDNRVVGWMMYTLEDTRIVLEYLGVEPESRGTGVGRQMMEKLASKLCPRKRSRVVVRVSETNLGSCRFLARLGFGSTLERSVAGPDTVKFVRWATAGERAVACPAS